MRLGAQHKGAGTRNARATPNSTRPNSRRLSLSRRYFQTRRREIAENKQRAEALFHSGADCKWTALKNQDGIYCRLNGRIFRLIKADDRKFHMVRLKALTDPGALVGRYNSRGDATAALQTIAYA